MCLLLLGNTRPRHSLSLFFCWIIHIISANEPSAIPETSERWTDDVYKLYFKKSSFTLKDLVYDVQKVIQSFPIEV